MLRATISIANNQLLITKYKWVCSIDSLKVLYLRQIEMTMIFYQVVVSTRQEEEALGPRTMAGRTKTPLATALAMARRVGKLRRTTTTTNSPELVLGKWVHDILRRSKNMQGGLHTSRNMRDLLSEKLERTHGPSLSELERSWPRINLTSGETRCDGRNSQRKNASLGKGIWGINLKRKMMRKKRSTRWTMTIPASIPTKRCKRSLRSRSSC